MIQNIDDSLLDDLMMAQEIKNIGRNGIRFLKADYFDEALYGIKEKAIIKYSLFDLSYIKVYTLKGEFICRANRVTSTHPLAHQMGDIKDIEDYKHKIEKQAKLRRKTIKAIKEHFSLEDIPLIESKMVNEIKIPDKPIIKPAPKEQKIIPKINLLQEHWGMCMLMKNIVRQAGFFQREALVIADIRGSRFLLIIKAGYM